LDKNIPHVILLQNSITVIKKYWNWIFAN